MITLLTDFGLLDAYVGVMKGVILGINPAATLVDLSHQIPAQDIHAAGFQLANAYPYFPNDTIHLVVVDPGVGSQRDAIAIGLDHGTLVGPNNGVFSALLQQAPPLSAVKLDRSDFWTQTTPSATFHGRDIFAPVAAHLSNGVKLSEVGTPFPLEHLIRQPLGQDDQHPDTGHIQAIDHFGNLITNLSGENVLAEANWAILYQGQVIPVSQTYSAVAPGEAIALVGSHGFIEIAINQGNAQAHFDARVNSPVRLACS